MKRFILASSSPTRQEYFARFNYPVEIIPSNYEEDMTLKVSPEELAITLALGKAESVAEHQKNAVVLGIDTFGVQKGELLGKPHTPDRAKEILRNLSGSSHQMISGYAIVDTDTGKKVTGTRTVTIKFREIDEGEIDAYVATGEPLEKAAAYASMERGGIFVDHVEGDFYAVQGIPISKIAEELKAFGIRLL